MKSRLFALAAALSISSPFATAAASAAPDAADLMVGAPPPAALQVTLANWRTAPYNTWAFHHVETLVRTTIVDRGVGPVSPLEAAPVDLTAFEFTDSTAKKRTLAQFLEEQHVDALLLYSNGKVRHEVFRNGMTARSRHIMWSVTKSFTGLIAEMLIAQGKLDESKRIVDYIPELNIAGGAYQDATLRNVLNMEVGIDYTEIYDDPSSTVFQFAYASGARPVPAGVTAFPSLYEFLPSLKKKGEHGQDFHYVSANSEVLGWAIEKVTGRGFAYIFEDMLYGKLGAERDAFLLTDPHGKAVSGGGLNVTARDALRLGVMMAQGGRFNGQQIVPGAVVAKIVAGGTPRPSHRGNENGGRDNSYISQWYIDRPYGVVFAAGIHGQTIYFQPTTGVVMAMQSSYPDADGPFFSVIHNFFIAVADRLAKQP